MGLIIEQAVVGPFAVNSYVVGDAQTHKAIVVDPGGNVDEIARLLEKQKLEPIAIYGTHAHIDHMANAAEAIRRFGVGLRLHESDRELLGKLKMQAVMFGFPEPEVPEVESWLEDGDPIPLGSLEGKVIFTPGHSPGGCCFYFAPEKALFCGDTLFRGSIGRTDLPGGSYDELDRALRDRVLTLGDEVRFYPGHGPSGTLGEERRTNPFVR
jgi:glyoxylase-like metal-dependent hydrolase (beta-lactamase superfamily II)